VGQRRGVLVQVVGPWHEHQSSGHLGLDQGNADRVHDSTTGGTNVKKTCDCGTVTISVDSDAATVKCNNCGWYYTYCAFPRRLLKTIEDLYTLIVKRGGQFGDSENTTDLAKSSE